MVDDYSRSNEIIDYLVSIAKNDGIVTSDETNFIEAMNIEIEKYKTEWFKSIEDGEITAEEKATLFKTRFKILQKALNIVREDLKVTEEEQELLNGLQKKLAELHKLENMHMNE
ncbi:MAG: hypothetical protein ACXAB7_02920 [Candidatus Kariarchaeaceae archaeon]|jgi:hypothetical protein